jgi:signal transduction histidine kinase
VEALVSAQPVPVAGVRPDAAPAPGLPNVDILARLGHDLRSPLGGITGLARIMRLRLSAGLVDPAHLIHQLELVQASADQMLATVDRVVDVARIDSEPVAPAGSPGGRTDDCRAVVAAAADLVPPAGGGPDVLIEAPDHPVPFAGPPDLLRRILAELVDNAVRYTDGPQVRVKVVPATPDSAASIEVSDDGPGIDAADQLLIFEPFQRGDTAAQQPLHGSGLGLYLARRIAARCGLRLDLTSTVGLGSSFHIRHA